MKKNFIWAVGALLICGVAEVFAQTTQDEMFSDLNRTGGVYYAYPVKESQNTPAPEGYEPFYISHYGRHGSRYLISDRDYESVAEVLHDADRHGVLTPLGKDVMKRLDNVMVETDKRGGDLTPLGARQHKGIAKRMMMSYPEVFKGNKTVSARSTLVVRCVLSMAAFCDQLKEMNPALDITCESSQRYMPYLCYHSDESNQWRDDPKNFRRAYRKFEEQHVNPDRLLSSLISDPEFIKFRVDPENFMWNMYYIASGMQDIETDIDFYDIFTPQELFDMWQCFNYRFYVGDGNYPGSNELIINNAKPLLRNILESAQSSIENLAGDAATLRFGHDGNLIPLAALMHLENCDLQESDSENFYKAFADWKIAPMAGNLQMIFFRNKKNPEDIIVKFMLNEEEKRIPIATDTFPFYKWDDVKNYYEGIIDGE
ncbi:MAG: histidine phosphatase family protein [Muribaculaceae bacterium]|nr:histidine phosphatase family protein [Muribaculaceae bacterium]MDE6559547.1 histidine phosphatase family protein [Muribaculaceae bacterium]